MIFIILKDQYGNIVILGPNNLPFLNDDIYIKIIFKETETP